MGLFFPKGPNLQLVKYTDKCYISSPHKGRSQTRYLFTYSNHSEIIAIHETSCESIWLRFIIQHIQEKKLDYPQSKTAQQNYSKTMLLISFNLKGATSKVTEPSKFYENSLIHMSFRRAVILMSSRYNQVKNCFISSLSLYQLQH
jgi:hypothetical protein